MLLKKKKHLLIPNYLKLPWTLSLEIRARSITEGGPKELIAGTYVLIQDCKCKPLIFKHMKKHDRLLSLSVQRNPKHFCLNSGSKCLQRKKHFTASLNSLYFLNTLKMKNSSREATEKSHRQEAQFRKQNGSHVTE